jgi:hypothetical protein
MVEFGMMIGVQHRIGADVGAPLERMGRGRDGELNVGLATKYSTRRHVLLLAPRYNSSPSKGTA